MGSYLAINKSGNSIPVYKPVMYKGAKLPSGTQIGEIYPNERFTYMSIRPYDGGGGDIEIRFLAPQGGYIEGFACIGSDSLRDQFARPWSDFNFGTIYGFKETGYALKTDRQVSIYSTSGNYLLSLPSGSTVYTDKQSSAGNTYPNWLYLLGYKIGNDPVELECFVDTGVASNSSDTGVYGNGF